jgi:hypothetical protein
LSEKKRFFYNFLLSTTTDTTELISERTATARHFLLRQIDFLNMTDYAKRPEITVETMVSESVGYEGPKMFGPIQASPSPSRIRIAQLQRVLPPSHFNSFDMLMDG